MTFTGDIPSSINSKFFENVGTADNPAMLDVPAEYRDHYAAKMNGNMFYGGYFTLVGVDKPTQKKGDLNGDGLVNSTDLVMLVNIIMGSTAKTDAADMNDDGQVNSTDLVMLVNIIMNQ